MTACETAAILQPLSESGDYYNTALALYDRGSRRIQRLSEWVDESLPGLAGSLSPGLPEDEEFRVLSVGPGEGDSDHRILRHLRDKAHPKIRAVVLEPDSYMIGQYQDLASKESTGLRDVEFDWRKETFQEYQAKAKDDERFHFITSFGSIYYCGDLEMSLKYLYEKLFHGGTLLIALMAGEGGFGRLWRHLQKTLGMKIDFFTSTDVERACMNQNIPIAEVQTIPIQCDILPCFDPPEQLSQDGKTFLDFFTHTVNFALNAPVEYRDDVLRFLRSEACSKIGPAGEVIFNGSDAAVIIRKE